jgi:hypothetical protein
MAQTGKSDSAALSRFMLNAARVIRSPASKKRSGAIALVIKKV